MAALPNFLHFLTVDEAARKYGLDLSWLHDLIERGKIRAGVIAGETIVSEEEVIEKLQREAEKAQRAETSGLRKEDLPEYRMHTRWIGVGIGINEAAKEYRIPYVTIYQWMNSGIIRKLGRQGQKVLLDRADVAYCAEIYHKKGAKGRKLFNSDGTPYKLKRESRRA